ncbi:hypothetical protein IWQ60_006298 [Tieghemiomyces parasiticus]|uniref:Uncharacterized protein n=1 Tax=Tieghemiomyces parasiticus TaxID=78921 RepID=A0A9W8A584_9FUNG|nr:hypothetical protein IWQ60_006298 [Tieghemiomyces parasiticus]
MDSKRKFASLVDYGSDSDSDASEDGQDSRICQTSTSKRPRAEDASEGTATVTSPPLAAKRSVAATAAVDGETSDADLDEDELAWRERRDQDRAETLRLRSRIYHLRTLQAERQARSPQRSPSLEGTPREKDSLSKMQPSSDPDMKVDERADGSESDTSSADVEALLDWRSQGIV